jgi:phytoene synthase
MSTAPSLTWEQTLLSLAAEVRQPYPAAPAFNPADPRLLDRANDYCEALTAAHSRSFYLATRFMPLEKRRAIRALYAFCRISDDCVDESRGDAARQLRLWRARALSPNPPPEDLVSLAWSDARSRFQIPLRYAEQLLDGVAHDLEQRRYQTFDDLATYAYGVASTVGLMSMHITGFSGPEAIPYAIKLGVALQITNILRDVSEDWRAGRIYLPLQELAVFGLTEADLVAARVDDRWRSFMAFQIARNRRLYAEAWPGIALLGQDGRLAVAAAATFYRAILSDIERHNYDVFNRRAHVGRWGKIRRLPGIWLSIARLRPPLSRSLS